MENEINETMKSKDSIETCSSEIDKTGEVVRSSEKKSDANEMQEQVEKLSRKQETGEDNVTASSGNKTVLNESNQAPNTSADVNKMDEIKMLTNCDSDSHTVTCKAETTDIEMDLAEDFTTRTCQHATVPQVTIKQEKTSYNEQIARERALESHAVVQIANSSLSLLSQYISSDSESNITDSEEEISRKSPVRARQDSSSDSEESVEMVPNTVNYRNQETAIVISDTETAPDDMDDYSDGDLHLSDEDPAEAAPIKARGETLVHELPAIEELQISVPEAQCKLVGRVDSIVAQIVIVQSYAGVELLNLDTVLFLEKGKRPLGKIFDVIGQVAAPMYCILFNSRQEVVRKGITVGTLVYCAPQTEYTSFIILSEVMKYKGSDASWLDDIEPPEYALEYSDDEQERRARTCRSGSCSSDGRNTPEGGRRFYRRGRGRGAYRGHRSGYSWHHSIPTASQAQRVINPYAIAAAASTPPPPPPPLPPSS